MEGFRERAGPKQIQLVHDLSKPRCISRAKVGERPANKLTEICLMRKVLGPIDLSYVRLSLSSARHPGKCSEGRTKSCLLGYQRPSYIRSLFRC